jgi:hypothetical protein
LTEDKDWVAEVKRMKRDGLSWTQIARIMMPLFPDKTEVQVREKVRTALPRPSKKAIKAEDKPILVYGDAHVPFDHPGFLPFLVDTYDKYRCGLVVNIGDQTDQHVFSRYTPEAIAKGAMEEYELAKARTEEYFKAFKRGYLCKSNHDLRYVKKAASVGIPELFLQSFKALYGVPAGWEIADSFIINEVLFMHGEGWSGETGALRAAQRNGMSVCIGHWHGLAGCLSTANERNLWFGMNVGCGVDRQAYAFAYGKHDVKKPILGCGIVYDGAHAEFVPMPARYFRST